MPFAYQLEVLEGMEASMRTTFYTTKRKEMATQMMATPSAVRDHELEHRMTSASRVR